MERLTKMRGNGFAIAACCEKACEYNYVCEVGGFGECRGIDDIIDRLAVIEDILGDDYDLDRLRELVEADRDGRCVVLPCRIGTPVWSSCYCSIDENGEEHPTGPWDFSIAMMDEWGKSWHLTKEDAEAALEGENENYDAEFWGEQEPAGSCTNCNFYSGGICHAEPGEGCT